MTDLADLDATAQAELVRSGEASATELVQAAIDRAERVNPEINAIVRDRYELALQEAADPGTGPFAGVPFVIKDLDGWTAGETFYGGTKFLKDHDFRPPVTTTLFERFRRAGLISIGHTNTPELGLVTTTEPDSYGPTRNPWNTGHSTGGSSGGSAAAVAAGIVPLGHAGDGGGSIRIPSSECGLFGLKPSRGRVTVGPEVGESWAGLVARLAVTHSVRDTAGLLDAVEGPGVGDPYWAPRPTRPYLQEVGADPGSLRIGFVRDLPDGSYKTDPEVSDALDATIELLTSLGHRVEESHPAPFGDPKATEHFITAYSVWVRRELDQLAELTGQPLTEDGFEAGTWATAEAGSLVPGALYLAALEGLHEVTRDAVAWWEVDGFDLLLSPTIPELPPTLGQFAATPDNPLNGLFRSAVTAGFAAPLNITGQPAISVPLHQSPSGLPIGMQFVGAPARDDLLIRIASQLEAALPWADRRPPVWAGQA